MRRAPPQPQSSGNVRLDLHQLFQRSFQLPPAAFRQAPETPPEHSFGNYSVV
jgi:hypothetical protein